MLDQPTLVSIMILTPFTEGTGFVPSTPETAHLGKSSLLLSFKVCTEIYRGTR
jgi:hypothetical protein